MKWIIKSANFVSIRSVYVCVVALGVLVLVVNIDVCLRNVVGRGIAGIVETVALLMMIIVFLSFANTQRLKGHIWVELFVQRLELQHRNILELIILIFCLAFACLILQQVAIEAYHSWLTGQYTFSAVKYLTWPSKMFMSIGMLVFVWQLFADMLVIIGRLKRGNSFKN